MGDPSEALKQQLAAVLNCSPGATPVVDSEMEEFLSQKFSPVDILPGMGVNCWFRTSTGTTSVWNPFGKSMRFRVSEIGSLLHGMNYPCIPEEDKEARETYQFELRGSEEYRVSILQNVAALNGDGSLMLRIDVVPGRPWPLADVVQVLCTRAEQIPDLPVPFDRRNSMFRGGEMFRLKDLSGWQVLLWVVLPMARFLYGILPPPQRFGQNRLERIARNQEQFSREMRNQVEMIPRFLQLRRQLPDSIDVRPGIMIGLSDVPPEQKFVPPPPVTFGPSPFAQDVEPRESSSAPPPSTEQKEIPDRFFEVRYRNPVPNRKRLNPGMGVGIEQNPQEFRQEQQDFPATAKRPAYKGSLSSFAPPEDQETMDEN